MKAIATISTVIMAAGMAAGQANPYKPAAPASQSPATTTAAKPAKPASTPAAKPAAAKPEAQAQDSSRGRRDPFVSPVIVRMGTSAGTSCSTGKRCLIIDQLTVQGVVKTNNGWIAVIGNPAKKVYYVRENDALFDGYVTRITGDSVVFRQNMLDALGKTVQREVVKRVAPSA